MIYPVQLSWRGRGREFQEQTRRVCDAATAKRASAESIRKRSAEYAMLFKEYPSPAKTYSMPIIPLIASPARIMPMTGGTKERLPGRCRPFSTITSLVSMGGSVE